MCLESVPLSEELLALASRGSTLIMIKEKRKYRIRKFDLFIIFALLESKLS
jgi:hypothetical protein